MRKDIRIMGIDPGTNKMGYGIIDVKNNMISVVVMGYIDLTKFKDPYQKLSHIFERTHSIIKEYKPFEVAYESPFFGENIQSMLKLGRAQGVAMAAALSLGIDVFEYAPRKIKIAITGSGGASKEQVASMLKIITSMDKIPENQDSTDGLAVAVTHYFQSNNSLNSNKHTSWSSFVESNKSRIIK